MKLLIIEFCPSLSLLFLSSRSSEHPSQSCLLQRRLPFNKVRKSARNEQLNRERKNPSEKQVLGAAFYTPILGSVDTCLPTYPVNRPVGVVQGCENTQCYSVTS
jgi:hypothetical protein